MKEEKIIISLGGSLIVPEEVDVEFLKDFRKLILSHVEKGKKFVIITGGGRICRIYQEAAKKVSNILDIDLDWIGIASLRMNAELLRVIFSDTAYGRVVNDSKDLNDNIINSIIIGGSREPGHSSDHFAVEIAKAIGAKKIINLSNTDYVYDSDPRTNPNAKKIEKISWAEYRALIPKEWNPGLNSPFDPIASELAEKEGITVATMNGKPIDNLVNFLDGKEFLGTTIS